MNEIEIMRVIKWFNIVGDERLVDREELKSISLQELVDVFGLNDDDPFMIDPYQIKAEHISTLQKHIKHKINLSDYDYFIGAYARVGYDTVLHHPDGRVYYLAPEKLEAFPNAYELKPKISGLE